MSWLINVYDCRGESCYFNDRFCSVIPIHIILIMIIFIISVWLFFDYLSRKTVKQINDRIEKNENKSKKRKKQRI